jgi:hypothetical protein
MMLPQQLPVHMPPLQTQLNTQSHITSYEPSSASHQGSSHQMLERWTLKESQGVRKSDV